MKISRLTVSGYKRLLLRNLSFFEIRPQSVYQLILGTNGSGKSSVLRELTPLPAHSGDYIKGGFKIIELEHRNKTYTLTSDFSVGNKHSFLCNNEELNPGGTVTIQKDLVLQHFGFSDSLHEVLNGLERFTDMSPMRRREMVILLSGADLGFAMEVFNKMKSKARDMVGVVKHLSQRLTNESSKLPSKEKLQEYFTTIETLKAELTLMMEAKDPSIKEADEFISERIKTNLSLIEELSIAIIEANIERPILLSETLLTKMEDLNESINQTKAQQLTAEQMHNHYLVELQKVSEIVEALQKSNADGIDDLLKRIETLKSERSSVASTLRTFKQQNKPQSLLAAFTVIQEDLIDIFSSIPSNENGYYSREKRDFFIAQLDKMNVQKEKNTIERYRLTERLEHIQTAKKENCPKCGYIYTPGASDNEIAMLSETLEKINSIEKKITEKQTEAQDYLESFKDYADLRKRFARIVDSYGDIKPLWDVLLEVIAKTPREGLLLIKAYYDDLMTSCRLNELDSDILSFETAFTKAGELNTDGHYIESFDLLADKVEEAAKDRNRYTKEIKILQDYKSVLLEVIEHYENIQRTYERIVQDVSLYSKAVRNDLLQRCINEHLSKLSYTEQFLISARAIKDVVQDLEFSLVEAKADAEVFKILADELSPTDGLIAEQLKGFIGCLVEQMNAIINQIWTYELNVLPCGMDSDELDYKFPLSVNAHELIVPDISKASTAQIDIINFAFRLVVMLYLELDDFPIYLDELAPSFDDQHRINLMNFITQLVETKKCSQLYMISHYAASHGSLLNADVCVMDDRNLMHKPDRVNHHVTLR